MKYFFTLSIMMLTILSYSQSEKKYIRQGNSNYYNEKYDESEVAYRKAMDENISSFEAAFNLGDALYKQGKYEEAAKQFEALTALDLNEEQMARVYHNLGNALLKNEKIEEGIGAYKQALRNTPSDHDTKYNLATAQRMLKQQQQQQQQQQNQDKNKDDKNQDKQNQDQQKDDQNKDKDKDKDKQDQQKQQQQQQQEQQAQQAQKQEISKEDAERMLEAMQVDEKELQEKLKKQKMKTQKVSVEKDW